MDKKYNFIYRKLVQDRDDIVGHVAYSLYKENKIQFIENFKKEHGGIEPGDKDFEAFHKISCLPDNINNYKRSAVELLRSFMNELLAEEAKEIENNVFRNHEDMLKRIVSELKPVKKSWWRELGMSILSTLVIILFIAFISFLLSLSDKGFQIIFTSDGNVNMKQTQSQIK